MYCFVKYFFISSTIDMNKNIFSIEKKLYDHVKSPLTDRFTGDASVVKKIGSLFRQRLVSKVSLLVGVSLFMLDTCKTRLSRAH